MLKPACVAKKYIVSTFLLNESYHSLNELGKMILDSSMIILLANSDVHNRLGAAQ